MLSRRAVTTRSNKAGSTLSQPAGESSSQSQSVANKKFPVYPRKSALHGPRKSQKLKRDSCSSEELFSSGSDEDTDVRKSTQEDEAKRESSSSPSLLNCSIPDPKDCSPNPKQKEETSSPCLKRNIPTIDKSVVAEKLTFDNITKANCSQAKSLSPELTESKVSQNEGLNVENNQIEAALLATKSTEFTNDDLEAIINLPKSLATLVDDHFDRSVPIETDSSDSSVPDQSQRKRIISQKARNKKYVLESDSDSSPTQSATVTKLNSKLVKTKTKSEKNNLWVDNIQSSLERGASVFDLAPELLLNTVKMFRECKDSTKLAENLDISLDKLNTVIELWDMTHESIPMNKKLSSPEPTTQCSSSGSVYPTPAFKSKLAATPAIKSNFEVDFDDFDLQDDATDFPPCDEDLPGCETEIPSFESNGISRNCNTQKKLLFSSKNKTVGSNKSISLDLTKVKMEKSFDEEMSQEYSASDTLDSSMNGSHNQSVASSNFTKQYTTSSSNYTATLASSTKSKFNASPAIKSNFNIDLDMSEFQDSPNDTVNLASDSSANFTPYSTKTLSLSSKKATYQSTYPSSSKSYSNDYQPSSFGTNYGSPYFQNDSATSHYENDGYDDYDQYDQPGIPEPVEFTKSPPKSPKKSPSKLKTLKSPSKSAQVSRTASKDPAIGDFVGNVTNDGITGEFDGLKFPHSKIMMQVFSSKFGLRSFRPNQLQTVNAAMLDNDCFVLMPTGGGKSLCYQLTALLCPGVTVVVSPLKALILDQVQRLLSLDIAAASLSGEISLSEQNLIYDKLRSNPPGLKLLYVTPEKLSQSARIMDILESLYSNRLLARFVIDEAHCVSQWGHDFRPDYTKLGILKKKFPRVPTMALTATATPRVRMDVLHQLGIPNSKWFLCSFNRPNLKYEVRPKKGKNKTLEDLIDVLRSPRLKGESGIVYCLSRNDCDDTAKQLKLNGIKAIPYHAGLADAKRAEAQNNWLNDRVHIVCATIAFGMGIDKPDVRFVIHYSLPKSVEGYYQESGRAGRDGDPAICILFYSYQDVTRNRRLIEMERENFKAKKVHLDNLYRMVAYCENKTDCRRAQQLEYFGQIFNAELCKQSPLTTCDNCSQLAKYKMIDVTEDCKAIVDAVRYISHGRSRDSSFTLLHFVDIFKGAEHAKIKKFNHDKVKLHGRGKAWTRTDVERLLRKLVLDEYLSEELVVMRDEIAVAYCRVGPKAGDLMNGKVRVTFPITDNAAAARADEPSSSNSLDASLEGQIGQLQQRCFRELITKCRLIAENLKCTFAAVMSVQTLRAMSVELPETPEQMLQVPGVTQANLDKYGSDLLDITVKFNAEKFLLLAEAAEKKIDNFDNQAPSTSGALSGSGRTGYSTTYESELERDGWISVANSGTSNYKFSPRKTARGRKSTTKTFWKRKTVRKTKAKAGTKRKSSGTPKKATGAGGTRKAAATSSSNARPAGGMGFMPAPQPAAKKMRF